MNLDKAIENKIVWEGTNKLVSYEYISFKEGNLMKYAKRKSKYKSVGNAELEYVGDFEIISEIEFNKYKNGDVV